MRRVAMVLSALLVVLFVAEAKVAPTTLENLVKVADFVVIAKVTEVKKSQGRYAAKANVQRVLKGAVGAMELEFLAQPTWTCDISTAEKGESVLLFLVRPTAKDQEDSIFPDPPNSKNLLRIAWSGRGRMPIRQIRGEDYVTLWTGDIRLPMSMATIDGPEPEYASFIRSVRLSKIIEFIEQQLKPSQTTIRS